MNFFLYPHWPYENFNWSNKSLWALVFWAPLKNTSHFVSIALELKGLRKCRLPELQVSWCFFFQKYLIYFPFLCFKCFSRTSCWSWGTSHLIFFYIAPSWRLPVEKSFRKLCAGNFARCELPYCFIKEYTAHWFWSNSKRGSWQPRVSTQVGWEGWSGNSN